MAATMNSGIISETLIEKALMILEGSSSVSVEKFTIEETDSTASMMLPLPGYKVNVSFRDEKESLLKNICLLVKKELKGKGASSQSLLQKEQAIYNNLFPDFSKQSVQYKLKSKRQLYLLAKEPIVNSFALNGPITLVNELEGTHNQFDCLIFKHFSEQPEFRPLKKLTTLDLTHSLLTLETLARFHANSYVYKKQLAKTNGKASVSAIELISKVPCAQEAFFTAKNASTVSPMYEECFDAICKIVETENPSLGLKLRRKIQGGAIFSRLKTLLENEKYENSELYVFCHGNLSVNSFLFKYSQNSAGPEPTECKFVNYEFLRYSPLAADLAMFFFNCVDASLRIEFEEKMVAHYCDSFENELVEKLGFPQTEFDVEEFHRKVEEQHYGKMMEFGFLSSCLLLPVDALLANGVKTQDKSKTVIKRIVELLNLDAQLQKRIFENVKICVKHKIL